MYSFTACYKLEHKRFPTATYTNDLEFSVNVWVFVCAGSSFSTEKKKSSGEMKIQRYVRVLNISSDMNTSTYCGCGYAWTWAQPKSRVCSCARTQIYNLVAVDFGLKPSVEVTFNHFKGILKNTQNCKFPSFHFDFKSTNFAKEIGGCVRIRWLIRREWSTCAMWKWKY